MYKILTVLAALLLLPACAQLDGLLAFGGDSTGIIGEVAEFGKDVEMESFRRFANGFDGYCEKTPDAIRNWARDNINANTDNYILPDICVPKPGADQ